MYWKTQPYRTNNRVRIIWVLMCYHLYQSFLLYVICKNKKENMTAKWRWHIGETNDKHSQAHSDRRMPADRHKNYVRYTNFHQIRRNKRLGMVHTNWWCRDQNFRKYFEMRKKNDIRPSDSGFQHFQLFDDVAKQNSEIAAMRLSQKAK